MTKYRIPAETTVLHTAAGMHPISFGSINLALDICGLRLSPMLQDELDFGPQIEYILAVTGEVIKVMNRADMGVGGQVL